MAKTAPRQPLDEDVQREVLRDYVSMLMEFSNRVALEALDRWPRTENGRWFPTWNELRDLCLEIARSTRRPAPPLPSSPERADAAERREMVQLMRALNLAIKAHKGQRVDTSTLDATGEAEFIRVRALLAADQGRLEGIAKARGFRNVAELMANRRLSQ
ncbi:MAG: hypothetical protein EBR82_61980 [Caulobacteraceae bacterium]|nr:hypothetical protein [Caulobacteraceae bacterium]